MAELRFGCQRACTTLNAVATLLALLLLVGSSLASSKGLVSTEQTAQAVHEQPRQLVGVDRWACTARQLSCRALQKTCCLTHPMGTCACAEHHMHAYLAPLSSNPPQWAPHRLPGGRENLIVTLLDGHVVSVDRESGQVQWTFDSGAPLVSAKQSPQGSGFNVFPGADGGLYAYHGVTKHTPGLEVCVPQGAWGWLKEGGDVRREANAMRLYILCMSQAAAVPVGGAGLC